MSALIAPRIRASSPRRRITRSPVARLVLLFLLLSVAPVALLAVASVRLASNAVTGEVEGRVRSAAALSSVAIGAELTGVSELVQSYARRPSLIRALASPRPDAAQLVPQLRDLRQVRPGFASTFLARMDGRLLQVLPATESILGSDFGFRDWYRGVTASGDTYVSEAYESRAAGHPLVVGVATIVREPAPRRRGRPLGILVGAYELEALGR
ncbi:MAG: cache domain-containing protein, partial [Actinobacteria bacterium]|nr:cache domain-containing protein [Actinomycetota bacterium]